jgi:hypothetical protein
MYSNDDSFFIEPVKTVLEGRTLIHTRSIFIDLSCCYNATSADTKRQATNQVGGRDDRLNCVREE